MTNLSEMLADAPWGLYLLDDASGNFQDSSGNNRHLTKVGNPDYRIPGPRGTYGVNFPDSSGATENYAIGTHDARTATVTYRCFVWLEELPTQPTPIAEITSGYNASNGEKILWIDTSGRLNWGGYTTSWEYINDPNPMPLKCWNDVTISVGAAGTKLRLNRVTVATGARTSTENVRANYLMLHGGRNGYVDGSPLRISRFAVWLSQVADARLDAHLDAFVAEFGLDAPLNLNKVEFDAGALLSWAVSLGATGYEYRIDGGTPVALTGTSVILSGLTNGTTYNFEVRAKSGATTSGWTSINVSPVAGIVYDNFDRANVVPALNALGTSTSGHMWEGRLGAIGIQSGQAYVTTSQENMALVPDVLSFDQTVEYLFTVADAGAVLRWRDNSNYWLVQNTSFYRRLNNTWLEVFRFSTGIPVGTLVKVAAYKRMIKVWHNGVYRAAIEDSVSLETDDRVGIRIYNPGGKLDNFRAYPTNPADFASVDGHVFKGRDSVAADSGGVV